MSQHVEQARTLDTGSGSGSRLELVAVILTGLGHVLIEVASQGMQGASESLAAPQHVFNLAAVAGWGGYVFYRGWRSRGILQEWGFRAAGFRSSLGAGLLLALAALPVLVGVGLWLGHLPVSAAFWLLLAVYPVWGLAQQFALQVLVRRNLEPLVRKPPMRVMLASLIFSLAHFPNTALMGLTLVAGLAFTAIFEWKRNLWAIGVVHGILGAAAYYLVLGKDPGTQLLNLVGRFLA